MNQSSLGDQDDTNLHQLSLGDTDGSTLGDQHDSKRHCRQLFKADENRETEDFLRAIVVTECHNLIYTIHFYY